MKKAPAVVTEMFDREVKTLELAIKTKKQEIAAVKGDLAGKESDLEELSARLQSLRDFMDADSPTAAEKGGKK